MLHRIFELLGCYICNMITFFYSLVQQKTNIDIEKKKKKVILFEQFEPFEFETITLFFMIMSQVYSLF